MLRNISKTIFLLSALPLFSVMASCGDDETTGSDDCTELTWYRDADGDNLGDPDNATQSCDQPSGFVSDMTDPDDADATNGAVDPVDPVDPTGYSGTGSVTQGFATTLESNLFPSGIRVAGLGTISSSDDIDWIVPADVNYTDNDFPFAPDLYNPYGDKFGSAAEALAALSADDIVEIDASGEVFTAYIFGDNYFEMYVNGIPVGKDAVPFTDFNSHIVQFRAERPFTVAMKLVDWEENLGLGSEDQATPYHPGDGGLVMAIQDGQGATVDITDDTWKAQTYYTAPIQDLSCLVEDGTRRLSSSCSDADAQDGSSFYGIHWALPENWSSESFDDSDWPSATTYTNDEIGVNNKQSYTNFTDVFDDSSNDPIFIWSTNVVLDNEVLIRKTIQ